MVTRSSTRRSAEPGRELGHRPLGGGLQAVERRAQIVRGAVEHGAHAERELLDLVEHGVDLARQCVDLVVRIAHRQPLRQIAAHDLGRHRRNRAGLRQNAPPHPEATAEAEQQRHHHRRDQPAHHEILDVLPLLHVVSHQHSIAARATESAVPAFRVRASHRRTAPIP